MLSLERLGHERSPRGDRQVLSWAWTSLRARPRVMAQRLPEGPASVLWRLPQDTLQLFLGQRLGGLWGGRGAFTLRRPLLLWVELAVSE